MHNHRHKSFHRKIFPLIALVMLIMGSSMSTATADNTGAPPGSPDKSGPFDSRPQPGDEEDSTPDNDPPVVSEDNEDSSEGSDSEFISKFREFLESDIDHNRVSEFPTDSSEMFVLLSLIEGDVKIGLPSEANLKASGQYVGNSKVVFGSNANADVEVAAVLGNGTRFVTTIEGADAPTRFTYPLVLPEGIRVRTKQEIGSAILVSNNEFGREIVVGYINVPWAYDAAGQSVSVSQVVTENEIILQVDHADATYPVYADPTYYNINCSYGYSRNFTSATHYIYWNGVCPLLNFYDSKGYWPVGTTYMGPHRTVKQHDECSYYPDTSLVHDHQVPCKAHDYCYDLAREGYTYVTKKACDDIFEDDLNKSCKNYKRYDPRRWACLGDIPYIMTAVRGLGSL